MKKPQQPTDARVRFCAKCGGWVSKWHQHFKLDADGIPAWPEITP